MFGTGHFSGLKWLYFLAQPKICEFEMSFLADQDIVRLDISMNVVHLMHFLNGDNELADVESCLCFGKDVLFDEKTQ